jgi:hypothetical protein
MSAFSSIGEFLEQTGTRFRVFDMGRRVEKIPREEFARFEAGEAPYPYPMQQHAWLGILGWNPDEPEERIIWFLKLGLDETGMLSLAARDDFLRRVVAAAEDQARAREAGEEPPADALEDNPHGFKPKEDRMAVFHAKALKSLGLAPSRFFEHARDYFAGKPGWDQWAFVGLQGIADFAARLDEDEHETLLAAAIPHLPESPLQALCHALENSRFSITLAEPLAQRLRAELEGQGRPEVIASLIRGLSHCQAAGLRRQLLTEVLEGPAGREVEVLAAIAGRSWADLQAPEVGQAFVEALARSKGGQEAFNHIMADLLFIPGMREPLLSYLRNPERSAELAQAMGALFRGLA